MVSRIDIPGIDHVVSRQVALWLQERRARSDQSLEEARPGPYLTVSRQKASGGDELGRLLATRLGWAFYDRALLDRMGDRRRIPGEALRRLEQGPHNPLHDAIVMALDKKYPGHHGYLKMMIATVTEVGVQGRAVIMGRGAHLLLPPEAGVRIRVIAPFAVRVRRAIERHGVAPEEASGWIRQADANQRALVRNTLHRDVDDCDAYDLVLNLGELDVEGGAAVVMAALEAKGCLTRAPRTQTA